MINPVSSPSTTAVSAVYSSSVAPAQPQQARSQKATPEANQPQDTVHISQKALAGGGDVDHDGDSK
jgi:hypothetical protein